MTERWQFFILIAAAYVLLPFSRWRKRQPARGKPGILIVQTGKIGDLVCTTPIFRAIKRTWPSAHIGVAVTALVAPLLSGNPYVDDVWLLNGEPGLGGKLKLIRQIRMRGYHWVLVFTPAAIGVIVGFLAGIPNRALTVLPEVPRLVRSVLLFANRYVSYQLRTSGFEHYCRMVQLIGPVDCGEPRELFPSDAARAKAAAFFARHGISDGDFPVGISVAAGKRNKEWPPDRFGALADLLIAHYGATIVWVGSADDRSFIGEAKAAMRREEATIVSAGEFTLAEVSALLKRLQLFIAVDTGPVYIADAMGVPVIDIAGPHDIRSQTPVGRFAWILPPPEFAPTLTLMDAPDSLEREPAIMATTVEMVWDGTRRFIEEHRLASARSSRDASGFAPARHD